MDARHSGELCVSIVPDTIIAPEIERVCSLIDVRDENMASFEDITGWRDELYDYHKTDFYKDSSKRVLYEMPPRIPLSAIYEYVDLVLKYSEIRDALKEVMNWSDQRSDEVLNIEDDPSYPYESDQKIGDFVSWFIMKRNIFPNREAFRFANQIAAEFLNGNIKFIRSPRSISLIHSKARERIDFDN